MIRHPRHELVDSAFFSRLPVEQFDIRIIFRPEPARSVLYVVHGIRHEPNGSFSSKTRLHQFSFQNERQLRSAVEYAVYVNGSVSAGFFDNAAGERNGR